MCTLVLLRHVHPSWPLVVAANRDEFFARPSTPPGILNREPLVFGGKDLKAGGTWFGVTSQGFFAGLTNQRLVQLPAQAPRSRGELVFEVLRHGNIASAMEWLREQDPSEFNAFNLVFGDCHEQVLAYGRADWRFEHAPDGISVLPNDELDSADFPKVERAKWFGDRLPTDENGFLEGVQHMLADTTCPEQYPDWGGPFDPDFQRSLHALCVVTPSYGTRSSTIVALQPGRVDRYLHADGPPNETTFLNYAVPDVERT